MKLHKLERKHFTNSSEAIKSQNLLATMATGSDHEPVIASMLCSCRIVASTVPPLKCDYLVSLCEKLNNAYHFIGYYLDANNL